MQYTGDPDDVCPISFVPVAELEHPVGFDARHAFECECIVEWLTVHKCTNPITGQTVAAVSVASVLHPLIVGTKSNVAETHRMLSIAGMTVGTTSWQQKVQNDVKLIFLHLLLAVIGYVVPTKPVHWMLVAAVAAFLRTDYPNFGPVAVLQGIAVSCCHLSCGSLEVNFVLLVYKFMLDFVTIVLGYDIV